ncbi:MAG: hypothetical protein AABZ57_07145, partial [Candidatus Margulisiibacteriota bacterium]
MTTEITRNVKKTGKNIKQAFFKYIKTLKKGNATTSFTISNTTKKINRFYFTPVRMYDGFLV